MHKRTLGHVLLATVIVGVSLSFSPRVLFADNGDADFESCVSECTHNSCQQGCLSMGDPSDCDSDCEDQCRTEESYASSSPSPPPSASASDDPSPPIPVSTGSDSDASYDPCSAFQGEDAGCPFH